MTRYKLTSNLHVGSLRRLINAGTPIMFDGQVARVEGTRDSIPLFDNLIAKGFARPWLEEDGEPDVTPEKKMAMTDREKWLQVNKDVDGWREHTWDKAEFGSTDKTCTRCGVTLLQSVVLVDRKRADGSYELNYRDARGVQFSSSHPLACPAYAGDAASAAVSAKQEVTRVRQQLGAVDAHLETVDTRIGAVEDTVSELLEKLGVLFDPAKLRELLAQATATPALLEDKVTVVDGDALETMLRERLASSEEEAVEIPVQNAEPGRRKGRAQTT